MDPAIYEKRHTGHPARLVAGQVPGCPTTSQPVPSVCKATDSLWPSRMAGVMPSATMGVWTGPGTMQFTRMPSRACQLAMDCVMPMTAALDAE